MHSPLYSALYALLAFPALAAGATLTDKATTAEIGKLESTWNEAHLRGDAQALAAPWADDLLVIVPGMAPMTKPEVLAFVRSGRMAFTTYETTNLQFRTFDRTIITTGNLHRSRVSAGHAVEDRWRVMKVYAKLKGLWQVVAFFAADASQS